jgi:hypothetical protein
MTRKGEAGIRHLEEIEPLYKTGIYQLQALDFPETTITAAQANRMYAECHGSMRRFVQAIQAERERRHPGSTTKRFREEPSPPVVNTLAPPDPPDTPPDTPPQPDPDHGETFP